MKSITERKKSELRSKLNSLERDFLYWRKLAVGQMGLHKTQINSLIGKEAGVLTQLTSILAEEIKRLEYVSSQVLCDARSLEEMLLAAHCIWGFFREKFAQRLDESTRPLLDVADELAWACYRPAMEAAGTKKAQPLVFLNGGLSPFMVPRGSRWNPDGVPGDLLANNEFSNILRSLPLPIIGVPYPQVTYLPDVIFVAHEAGHAVETDYKLTQTLIGSIREKTKGTKRLRDWEGWMGECFADAWAVAHVGPAYVAALQDFLAPDHSKSGNSNYPPNALRVQLAHAFLAEMDFGLNEESTLIRSQWTEAELTEATGSSHTELTTELTAVADALLNCSLEPLGGMTTKKMGGYTSQRHEAAKNAARLAESNRIIPESDPRVLFSALRMSLANNPDVFNRLPTASGGKSVSDRYMEKLKPSDIARANHPSLSVAINLHDRLKSITVVSSPFLSSIEAIS